MKNNLIGIAVLLFLALPNTGHEDGGLFIQTVINVPVTVIHSK